MNGIPCGSLFEQVYDSCQRIVACCKEHLDSILQWCPTALAIRGKLSKYSGDYVRMIPQLQGQLESILMHEVREK